MSETTADRTEEIQAFLNDLQALSEKHGIWLDSCGCCESIYMLSLRWDEWLNEPREGELRYRSHGKEALGATRWHGLEKEPWGLENLIVAEEKTEP